LEIIEFLKLVKKAHQKSLTSSGVHKLLQKHQYLWGWLMTDLHYGIPLGFDELKERFEEETLTDYEAKLKEYTQHLIKDRQKRGKLIKDLNPSQYLRGQMEMLSFETWLKTYRRYFTTQVVYYGRNLFAEIAKRARIDLASLWWTTPVEVRSFLKRNQTLHEKELKKRYDYMVLLTESGENKILLGQKAKSFLEKEVQVEKVESTKVLHGRPASAGKAEGAAKVILDHSQVEKIIHEGDVVVATQAPPSFIRAIKRASAVLVEEGAITSHASILCREFGTPCIVGLKNITQIVRTGEDLLVNATNGVVERL
jgi:phosphohistidine swiveling domain-containing protein